MPYPEDASYRYKPAWMDRARAAEGVSKGSAGEMLDYHRSIDDIVKEGSDPSASSGFTSSSPRDSVNSEEIRRWGTPENARAAADARANARPMTPEDRDSILNRMAPPIGWAHGGSVGRRSGGRKK